MAARAGRRVILVWNGAQIPGVREKGVKLDGAPIDITSDDDGGWKELLEEDVAEKSVEISLSGVSKSSVLKNAWFGQNRIATASLTYPDGSVITATFHLASYSETDPYKDASTFSATLQSSGEVSYTPYS